MYGKNLETAFDKKKRKENESFMYHEGLYNVCLEIYVEGNE